jgi:uncharacterized protein YcfL
MKQLLLLLLISFSIVGCKKTKTEASDTLSGEWTSKTVLYEYKTTANILLFSETDTYDAIWSFSSSNVTLKIAGTSDVTSKYAITTESGIQYISFDNKNIAVINKYEVKSRTASSITLSASDTNPINSIYFENSIPKKADKVVYTITLNKK